MDISCSLKISKLEPGDCFMDTDSRGNFYGVAVTPEGSSSGWVHLSGSEKRIGALTDDPGDRTALQFVRIAFRPKKKGLYVPGALVVRDEDLLIIAMKENENTRLVNLRNGTIFDSGLNSPIAIATRWSIIRRDKDKTSVVCSINVGSQGREPKRPIEYRIA